MSLNNMSAAINYELNKIKPEKLVLQGNPQQHHQSSPFPVLMVLMNVTSFKSKIHMTCMSRLKKKEVQCPTYTTRLKKEVPNQTKETNFCVCARARVCVEIENFPYCNYGGANHIISNC